jgi:hypothetical protein
MKSKLSCLFLLLAAPLLHAQSTPSLMSYQGRVTDGAGVLIGNTSPVNRTVTFRLYTASSGGAALYAETQTVTISGGEFSVLIGNGSGITGSPGPSAPASTPYKTLSDIINSSTYSSLYLGVTVDDGTTAADPEIAPRQQMVSGVFALRSKVAESVAGGAVTTAMIGDGQVSTGKIASGAVDSSRILDSSIVATDIANNTITAGKLDPGTIGLWTPQGSSVYRSSGNVGIGEANPGFPLNFASTMGDKISLYGNSGAHYGIGMQTNVLQIHSDTSSSDIAFGFGNSSSFTERMRVKGNGNVGIGTSTPSEKLSIQDGRLWFTTATGNGDNGGIGGTMASSDAWRIYGSGDNNNGGLYIDTGDDANEPIVFRQSGNERIRINSDGHLTVSNRLGIGTSVPNAQLTVGNAMTGTALSGTFTANSGALGTGAGSELFLASFGCTTANNSSLGVSAYRYSTGSDWFSTSMILGMNVDNSVRAGSWMALAPVGIGIGTVTPRGKLEVNGSSSQTYNADDYSVGSGWNNLGGVTSFTQPISIWASNTVLCSMIQVFSDERVKVDIHPTESPRDLQTLMGIEISDYHYKDVLKFGKQPQKKVIAQQLEKVYPQAVSTMTDVVPDIFEKAAVEDGWVVLATDLKVGDRVKLIGKKEEAVHEVLEVRKGAFRTDGKVDAESLFVYGREVEDFRTVDYDAISMLNVSATQELAKKLEEKDAVIAALEARLSALEKRVSAAK